MDHPPHGFFYRRLPLEIEGGGGGDGPEREWGRYRNISGSLGAVISSKLATLHELQTVYGVEDLYNLLEIVAVDNYNQMLASKREE